MKKINKLLALFLIMCLLIPNTKAFYINQVSDSGGITSNSDVSVSKTIEEVGSENYFDITLKVSTPYNIEKIRNTDDVSIIIVMDISNTMVTTNIDGTLNEDNPSGDTRYKAAMNAGMNFINTFFEYSKDSSSKRKIGYVAFNSDATKIFDLQEITGQDKAEELINTMKDKTNSIVSQTNYSKSKKRFTNIEAGLKMAGDMLDKSGSKNKYVLVLSDGFPTTYIKDGYTGYDTYTPSAVKSSIGQFYNSNKNLPCSYGVSYSDRAAERAQEQASKLKNKGITIFSVGAGLDGQTSISDLMTHDSNTFSVVDSYKNYDNKIKYGYNYVIGDSVNDFKNWLKNSIGSGYYYDTNDTQKLIEAYKDIFDNIEKINQMKVETSWVVNDTINNDSDKFIEFLGFYDSNNGLVDSISGVYGENNTNTASISDDKLLWDLKKSGYTLVEEGSKKLYNYTIKYRVRLKNELSTFDKNSIYNTNGDTYLNYRINNDGILSDEKNIQFKVPKVIGFLADLSFVKVSSLDLSPLEGVKFKLTHNSEKCGDPSHVKIDDMYAVSDSNGVVKFENVPSGHNYILTEEETLEEYVKDSTEYNVNISYGEILLNPELQIDNDTLILKNNPRSGSLKISKIVDKGDKNKKFEFVLKFDNNLVNGKYGDLDFNNGVAKFALKDGESVTISNIPIGTKYEIEELSDGYDTISENAKGEIKENEIIESKFINTLNEIEIIPPKTLDSLSNFIFTLVLSIVGFLSICLFYKKLSTK